MALEHVLVVDDDETILGLMELVLRRSGYEVDTAGDGNQALEVMRTRGPYSVLVTDLFMPGKSGMEVAIEAHNIDPYVEVIIITAGASLESAITALRGGNAFDYLIKPFELKSQLSVAVQRAAAHRSLVLEREELQIRAETEANRLQAVIRSTGDAILAADAAGHLTIANPAACRLLGREDLVGCSAAACLPAPLAALIPGPDGEGNLYPAMVEVKLAGNSVHAVTLTPLNNGGPKAQHAWMMVARDITHLKHLDNLKSQLLAETARRINEPLAESLDNLTLLKALSTSGNVSEISARLLLDWGQIQSWANAMLLLAQVDASLNIRMAPVNLLEILNEIGKQRADELDVKYALKLEIDAPSSLPDLLADPDLLNRLVNVLIDRAAARSSPGGTINMRISERHDEIWTDIRDDGLPVSASDLPYLFEKTFVNINGHNGRSAGMTGLELAMVKTIVDHMNGRVWVGNMEPRGGNIIFSLPKLKNP